MTEQERKDIDAALDRMGDFFETEIRPNEMAKKLRQASYMLTQLKLRDTEMNGWDTLVEDANFSLHFLAEQLRPDLDEIF